ncbi:MAG: peptidoglycan DD-metalloendopeptidase family protein [Tannerella sp.]|nr:peptidoglycan DD-metalloendopeptidase family protein [Tannerella sp.]
MFRGGVILALLLAGFLFPAGNVSAQTQTLKQLEAQRKAALEEIEVTAQLLDETRSSAQYSLNRLNLLSEQVLARKQVISLLNQEIALMNKDIEDMNTELSVLRQNLTVIYDKYAKSLQNMYARRSIQYKWFFVLSADNFTQSLRRMRYLREYSEWQKHQASLIIKKQNEINMKQAEVGQVRIEKLALLDIREKESSQLQMEESEQKIEVQQFNKKQKDLQAELSQKKKQAEALNRQIENLIGKEIVGSSGKTPGSRETDLGAKTGTGVETGYSMTKEERRLSTDFASNRGRLPFPLTGKYKIVGSFGEHQHPKLKHVQINNNGIDIQTTSGAEAQTVFNGVITAIFVETGYNHGIIVRHGNYLTVYANLSEVYVKTGDKVSTRQKLGKISTNTEDDHATVLHFELRKEKKALNPVIWLN